MTTEALLRLLLQPASSPVLEDDEVEQLVTLADNGAGIERAVALGWRMRAAKAAGQYDLKADGNELSRSQVVAQCNAQAAAWEASADAAAGGSSTIASIVVSR